MRAVCMKYAAPAGGAEARIRTWEPLRDKVLSLAPLARLGYLRASPVAEASY